MSVRSIARCGLLAALALAQPAWAQGPSTGSGRDYPSRSIKLVVTFTMGGASDLAARVVGQKLSEKLGQPVVVENRLGANGTIGTQIVAQSPPDGYTLVIGTNPNITINPHLRKLSFDPMKDLVPVAMLTVTPMMLFVNPSVVPVKNLAEFVAYVKARPGKVDYASAGSGSLAHLAGELLKLSAGISMVHVPYKGGTLGVNDVLAGQVGSMFASVPAVLPQIRSGRLRAIATTGTQRSVFAPDIPTIAESGYPDVEALLWNGLFAPAGTPEPVLRKLRQEVRTILARSDVKDLLIKQGAEAMPMSDRQFRDFVQREHARWGRVIREATIKAE
jgi:tripartite-type tricarboxylate transporter receptor subunit TctC